MAAIPKNPGPGLIIYQNDQQYFCGKNAYLKFDGEWMRNIWTNYCILVQGFRVTCVMYDMGVMEDSWMGLYFTELD